MRTRTQNATPRTKADLSGISQMENRIPLFKLCYLPETRQADGHDL